MTQVVHSVGIKSIRKDVHNPSFLLSNKIGGYVFLSNYPISRYQGVFFNEKFEEYKAIENIIPLECPEISQVTNKFYKVKRKRDNIKENFLLPINHNALVYEISEQKPILVQLDARNSYDTREYGRYYKIKQENNKIIIEFTKKTDKTEDKSHGKKEYKIYIVIDGKDYEKIDKFVPVQYSFDEKRKSPPYQRYVYDALKINAKKLIITFSTEKLKAIRENDYIVKNLTKLKKDQLMYNGLFPKKFWNKKISIAYKAANTSLNYLVNKIDDKVGVYAGLPWFFQFWARDEAISLKALLLENKFDTVKEILFRQLNKIETDGRLRNRFPEYKAGEVLKSADGIGWVIKRTSDFIEILQKNKIILEYLTENEVRFIKNKVEYAVSRLVKSHTKDDFAVNATKETWMDTDYKKKDGRKGARIEIQALRLNMYKLMKTLSKGINDNVGYDMASHLEETLRKKVRKYFFKKNYLYDGLNDPTIRPNIFLACYIYPELLTKKEWIVCFKKIIPKLWLDFGFASIDMEDERFFKWHTGQDGVSYHRGDSWYFVNNIAAICMARVSKLTFGRYIRRILENNTNEILWHGIIGAHAEISSAGNQESFGCWNQAWSNATYIELVRELFNKK